MKDTVIFLGHLGLGDHIIQQGIVNRLAMQYGYVLIFCKHHNLKSVRHMCRSNVDIIPVSGDIEVNQIYPQIEDIDIVSVGLYNKNWESFDADKIAFDKYFYQQAKMDFEVSYEVEFDAPVLIDNNIMKLSFNKPFCFIHDDKDRGFEIDMNRIHTDLTIVRPSIRAEKIFDYIPLIQKAAEIHCVDSSFALMIDRANIKCDKKYIHRYVRSDSHNPSYKDDWNIICPDK